MSGMKEVIAVAIDFGTTYSGIAYTRVNNGEMQPTQLGDWPGQTALRYKVPTIVAYSEKDPMLWGFQAEQSTQIEYSHYTRLRLFKLFLDPRFSSQCVTPPELTLEDVVKFYINSLYSHLIRVLSEEGFPIDRIKFNFLLTVPATFGNGAVGNFRRIIERTGIGAHKFSVSLTEPEAAALYTMKSMPMRTNNDYRVNDCFVVCDAGGGTVDLSSYTITQLNPVVRVKQTGVVSGAYCGSTYIDKSFKVYLETQIGEEVWRNLTANEKESMNEEFIRRKELFGNNSYDNTFNIRLARDDIPCKGKKNGFLPISREQMQSFFEESVEKTKIMITDHIMKCKSVGHEVSFLFLVGGFGTSPYLKRQIEDHVHRIDNKIQVIKPIDAQQAVVRGSIINQMQFLKEEADPVQSRMCRAHYGLVTMEPFNLVRHAQNDRYKNPDTGVEWAMGEISWLVQKGEQIDGATKVITKDFTQNFKVCNDVWQELLVRSDRDDAPQRLGPGVDHICTLTSDLRSCPKNEFEKRKKWKKWGCFSYRSGTYYQAAYTIKVSIGATDISTEMIYKETSRSDLISSSWDTGLDDRSKES